MYSKISEAIIILKSHFPIGFPHSSIYILRKNLGTGSISLRLQLKSIFSKISASGTSLAVMFIPCFAKNIDKMPLPEPNSIIFLSRKKSRFF